MSSLSFSHHSSPSPRRRPALRTLPRPPQFFLGGGSSLESLLGAPRNLLIGAPWGRLEASWAPSGRLLGASGGFLKALCREPRSSSTTGSRFGMLRGASWDHLGPSWGSLWAILGPCWAVLGLSWTVWEPFWVILGRFSVPLGQSRTPGRPKNRVAKNHTKTQDKFV